MRLREEPGRLVIRNSPRLYWIAGALLAVVGVVSLAAAVGAAGGGRVSSPPFRVGAGVLGGLACALGIWVCWRSPVSTLVLDRAGQTVTLRDRGLIRTSMERYPAAAISDVRVTKERDARKRPVYRVELVLHSGDVVLVRPTHPRDREGCMRAAERLWAVLDLPRA